MIITDFIIISPSTLVLSIINEEKKEFDHFVKESFLEIYILEENNKEDEICLSISKNQNVFKIPDYLRGYELKLKNFKNENKFFVFAKNKVFLIEITQKKEKVKEFNVTSESLIEPLVYCIESSLVTQSWDDTLVCLDLFSGLMICKYQEEHKKYALVSQFNISSPKAFLAVPHPSSNGILILVSKTNSIHMLEFDGEKTELIHKVKLQKTISSFLNYNDKNLTIFYGTVCGSFGTLKLLNFESSSQVQQLYSLQSDGHFILTKAKEIRNERIIKDYLNSLSPNKKVWF